MKPGQILKPKSPRAAAITAVVCVVLVLLYAASAYLWPWSPKRGLGLVLGFFAAGAFVFEMLYPARRPRARPLGTAKTWIQTHIYVGAIAFVAVVAHSGFAWPGGLMGFALLGLSAWTTATGLLGVLLQKWIPTALAEGLQVEALYERMPEIVQELAAQGEALAADTSDAFQRFFRDEVRPSLQALRPSWGYLFDPRAGRGRALEPFDRIVGFVDDAEKEKIEELKGIYSDKLDIDAQRTLQGLLRRWLILHVPTAGILMGLLVIHAFTWLWY